MPQWDIGYFDNSVKRTVEDRKITNRIIAWELGKEYYDGARENGYGGFTYDGRWKTLIPKIIDRYGLTPASAVLDLGCKKGFFINDLKECVPGITALGVVGGAMNLDFLLGAGVADQVETCSLGFGEYARVAPNYERLQKQGRMRMLDNT